MTQASWPASWPLLIALALSTTTSAILGLGDAVKVNVALPWTDTSRCDLVVSALSGTITWALI